MLLQYQAAGNHRAKIAMHGEVERRILTVHRGEEGIHPDVRVQFLADFPHQRLFPALARLHLPAGELPVILELAVAALGGEVLPVADDDRCHHFDALAHHIHLSFLPDAPERDGLSVGELFHPPGRFEATGHEVHGHEQADAEHVEKLTRPAGVAVTDASVYEEHHYVETVGELADVFQFAQVTFFFLQGVDVHAEIGAVDHTSVVVVGQEAGVPVVQVAGMEDALAAGFNHPRHTAVGASSGGHMHQLVFPRGSLAQPGIGLVLLRTAVLQDVFRKDVAEVRLRSPPGEDVAGEMVFVEMAGEHVHRLGRPQQTEHHAGRVHPVIEHEDAAVGLEGKAAVEDIGELHRFS